MGQHCVLSTIFPGPCISYMLFAHTGCAGGSLEPGSQNAHSSLSQVRICTASTIAYFSFSSLVYNHPLSLLSRYTY